MMENMTLPVNVTAFLQQKFMRQMQKFKGLSGVFCLDFFLPSSGKQT